MVKLMLGKFGSNFKPLRYLLFIYLFVYLFALAYFETCMSHSAGSPDVYNPPASA